MENSKKTDAKLADRSMLQLTIELSSTRTEIENCSSCWQRSAQSALHVEAMPTAKDGWLTRIGGRRVLMSLFGLWPAVSCVTV
eukprot:6473683-Amphidinium_carterae.1